MNLAVVVLAAGKGTRMRSQLPKVLHPLAGQPLVHYSIDLASRLSPEPPVLIIGHQADHLRRAITRPVRFVEQKDQLGTGHALMQTESLLKDETDLILVFAADMPLLRVESLRQVVAVHGEHEGPLTMITVDSPTPRGFGRIVRGLNGEVLAIVEEAEASPQQRAITELNVGVYCFDAGWLWHALPQLQPSPRKGEYYLTDLISLVVAEGHQVRTVSCQDLTETMGINTRTHLAEAERILRQRITRKLMDQGVTLIDPDATYVHAQATVGVDVLLEPGVCLFGHTHVGDGCTIGAHSVLTDVDVGENAWIGPGVILTQTTVAAGARISADQP